MLDAGSVVTTLRGKFDRAAFEQFDAANKQAAARAEAAEARVVAAQERVAKSEARVQKAQEARLFATRQSALAESEHAKAIAQTESQMATLEKTIRSSGVATKLQAAELDVLAKRHAALSSEMESTSRRTSLLSAASKDASKNLETLGRIGAKGAAVGLLSLAGATLYAVKTAGDFEKQMRNVNSIAKLPEAAYHKLSQSVVDLAGETAQAPKVLAEGLYALVSSGFDASDSLTILHASAIAATAGLTDTATSTKAVSAVLNAYHEPASKATEVSDVLFETVNRGVLTFGELASHIGDALPFAASLGVALPEVGAAISTMTKEGINSAETITRVKQVMESLIKPSKDMAIAIKATGASSGEALVHQKGLEGALEAVIHTTDGSKASLAKLFPNIRALGGALAVTGNNAQSAAKDLKAFQDTSGATQKVFSEQAKGAEFAGKQLVTSIESSAITIGNKFLPALAKGASDVSQALQHAAHDGELDKVAQDLENTFTTLGHAAEDLAPPIELAGKALVGLGKAAGLGDAREIAALAAAFLTFKSVTFVLPIIAGALDGIKKVAAAAADADGLAGFIGGLSEAGVLLPGIGVAAAAVAGAFVLLGGHEESEAEAAKKVTEAKQAEAQAISAVHDAVLAAADATFGAAKADGELKAAKEHLSAVANKYGKDSSQYRDALTKEREVALQDTAQHDLLSKSKEAIAKADREATKEAKGHVKTAKELFEAEFRTNTGKGAHGEITGAQFNQDLIASLEKYNATVQEAAKGTAVAAISAIQLDHVLAGQPLLTENAALAVSKLTGIWDELTEAQQKQLAATPEAQLKEIGNLVGQLHGVSKSETVRLLVDAKGAQAQVQALKAVLAGVPPAEVIQIETNAKSAQEQIEALKAAARGVPASRVLAIESNASPTNVKVKELAAAIDRLHGKAIGIATNAPAARAAIESVQSAVDRLHGVQLAVNILQTTTELINRAMPHARGRANGTAERALVGEGNGPEWVVNAKTGRGFKVTAPTVLGLSSQDYVIPTEDRFRGRALGLYAMIGRDLGIPGYAKGKKPKHHRVPDAVPPLSLPLAEIEQKQERAHEQYTKAASKVHSVEGKLQTAERDVREATSKTTKQKDQARVRELQKELKKAKSAKGYTVEHRKMLEWQQTLRDAKAYQARIDKETALANIARNEMQLADERGDEGGYQAAKGRRLTALGELKQLLLGSQKVVKRVKGQDAYFRKLQEEIGSAEIEQQTTAGEEPGEFTPGQERQLQQLEANVALTALTPGLSDDTTAAQQLAGFLESALSTAEVEHRPPEVIKELAGQLANARSNLESLAGGGGSNENPNVQAQITQANERAEAAQQQAQTAERALQVLQGSGDIGSGGANATAATVIINQNNMHPADPAVLKQIGAAAAAGFGYQGGRPSPRIQVGPR
jgi:TP901 family phage tail tape measure protein